jgi:hypothetical protein
MQESLRSGANATSLVHAPVSEAVPAIGKHHLQAEPTGEHCDVNMADCPGSAGPGGMVLLQDSVLME